MALRLEGLLGMDQEAFDRIFGGNVLPYPTTGFRTE